MKVYKNDKIQKSLKRKGFCEDPGKDHVFLVFYYDEKPTNIRTKLSRGKSEPGKDIMVKIRKQLKLNIQYDFEKLIDCSMSKEDYIQFLRKNNILE